ncbi:MAG: glycosyltransferase family 2 protein [Thermosphaera sp.]
MNRKKFSIIVYTVCFNEELILPHFLNYYSRIANKIVIYDNQSTDQSVNIATSYPNVELRSFDTGGKVSELTLTNIRRNCWKEEKSDYVIVCDADEFLYVKDLQEFLAKHHDYDVFRPVGFNMVSNKFPTDYGKLITEQVKSGAYAPAFSKMVLFKPETVREIGYGPGSHKAYPVGFKQLKVYDALQNNADLKLLHYKFLGLDYVTKRYAFLSSRLGEEYQKYKYDFHFGLKAAAYKKKFLQLKILSFNCIDRRSHPLFTIAKLLAKFTR